VIPDANGVEEDYIWYGSDGIMPLNGEIVMTVRNGTDYTFAINNLVMDSSLAGPPGRATGRVMLNGTIRFDVAFSSEGNQIDP
jgi:hypothetical protein